MLIGLNAQNGPRTDPIVGATVKTYSHGMSMTVTLTVSSWFFNAMQCNQSTRCNHIDAYYDAGRPIQLPRH